jgi:CelD/BcsL family acetyltransferase involved in cellulose biosynthesis
VDETFRTEVVTTTEGFASLEPEWTALAARFGSALGTFEWLDACHRFLNTGKRLAVFVTRDASAVRAIAPLMADGIGPFRRLVALGRGSGEPTVFIYDSPEALAALCSAIVDHGAPVAITRLYSDAPELAALRDAGTARGRVVSRASSGEGAGSSRVVLTGVDWETLLSRMSSSNRNFMRRKRRIAELEGEVVFEVVSPGEADVEGWVERIFAIEGSGWKGRAGTSLDSDARKQRFFSEFARNTARAGMLRVFALRIGSAIAAIQMDLEFGRRLWGIKIGYDERFSRASPGIVLMHDILAWACSQQLDAYDFLGEYESWHRQWVPERYYFATFYYYPRRIPGLLALASDSLRYAQRRLAEKRNADSDIRAPELVAAKENEQ